MIVTSSLKHSTGPTEWKKHKDFPDQSLLNFSDSQEGLVMFGKDNIRLGKGITASHPWVIKWARTSGFVLVLTQE